MSNYPLFSDNSIFRLPSRPAAPSVPDANSGNVLYPILDTPAPYSYALEVRYDGMADDQFIEPQLLVQGVEHPILLEGKYGDAAAGVVVFFITAEQMSWCIDNDLICNYTVTSETVWVVSDDLNLTVQRLLDGDVPMPILPQADYQNNLDLREIRGPVIFRQPIFEFARPGMFVWCYMEGLDINSNLFTTQLIQGRVLTAEEITDGYISTVIDRDELARCQDYSAITLITWVSFQSVNDWNDATELKRSTYRIRQIDALSVLTEDFENAPLQLIAENESFTLPTMEVSLAAGSPHKAGITTYGWSIPDMRSGRSLAMCVNIQHSVPPQKVVIKLPNSVVRIKFAVTWVQIDCLINLYDNADNLIDCLTLGNSNFQLWADFSASVGISRIEVSASDHCFIDYVWMWIKP